ncbi:unnamed protein product, partial [Ostreobium quekettii]
TAFASVEEACRCLESNPYDTILAEAEDLRCQKGDAEQLVWSKGSVPLILMSESEAPGDVLQGISLGAVDFLKRPVSPLKLRNIWQHAVRRMMGDASMAEKPDGEVDVAPVPPAATAANPAAGAIGTSGSGSSGSATAGPLAGAGAGSAAAEQEMASDRKRLKIPRENGSAATYRPPPLAMKPPVFSLPPLMGIPPGCVPPAGPSGMAIGMPVLNQPPFAPPSASPLGVMPPSLAPSSVPSLSGAMPGAMPFPGFPMVPPPMGIVPQMPLGSVPGPMGGGMDPTLAGACPPLDACAPASGQVGNSNDEVNTSEAQAKTADGDHVMTDEAETAPLGLSLKKSPSLINMISNDLSNLCSTGNPV